MIKIHRFSLLLILLVMASMLLSAGCAKKEKAASPQVVVVEDTQPAPKPMPKPQPAPAPAEMTVEEAMSLLGQPIYFDFDRFEVKPLAEDVLKYKAELLQKFPQISIVIEGHCDERGTNEYNMGLGDRRAKSTVNYLGILGIDEKRFTMISYGEERPADPGHNEEAWAKNRRCEFLPSR